MSFLQSWPRKNTDNIEFTHTMFSMFKIKFGCLRPLIFTPNILDHGHTLVSICDYQCSKIDALKLVYPSRSTSLSPFSGLYALSSCPKLGLSLKLKAPIFIKDCKEISFLILIFKCYTIKNSEKY